MTDIPRYPLVPQVEYVPYGEVERGLLEEWRVAMHQGDRRRQAELDIEIAHRQMIRRDAELADLVGAVRANDGEAVQNHVRGYAHWSQSFQEYLRNAEREATAWRAEQEAER